MSERVQLDLATITSMSKNLKDFLVRGNQEILWPSSEIKIGKLDYF